MGIVSIIIIIAVLRSLFRPWHRRPPFGGWMHHHRPPFGGPGMHHPPMGGGFGPGHGPGGFGGPGGFH